MTIPDDDIIEMEDIIEMDEIIDETEVVQDHVKEGSNIIGDDLGPEIEMIIGISATDVRAGTARIVIEGQPFHLYNALN